MLKPEQVSEIVSRTLADLDVRNPFMGMLIKGTFALESKLEVLYDSKRKLHGLMLLDEHNLATLVHEHIKYKPVLKDAMYNATGIYVDDISLNDMDQFYKDVDCNIALMVVMTYAYYNATGEDVDTDDLEDLGKFYMRHYCDRDDVLVEDFVKTYKEFYINP